MSEIYLLSDVFLQWNFAMLVVLPDLNSIQLWILRNKLLNNYGLSNEILEFKMLQFMYIWLPWKILVTMQVSTIEWIKCWYFHRNTVTTTTTVENFVSLEMKINSIVFVVCCLVSLNKMVKKRKSFISCFYFLLCIRFPSLLLDRTENSNENWGG